MIVCLCRRISDRDIAREVAAGCSSFEQLQDETGVSTACGCCLDTARATFDALAAPVPRIGTLLHAGCGAACGGACGARSEPLPLAA